MSLSNLFFDPLRDSSTISSLQTLTRLLETSIGPKGKLKLLGNSQELTSSSQRLLYHIPIKNIFSKIIVSTAKTQLRTFNDGGLFCALLTLKLVCPSTFESNRSLPLVGTLYEHFSGEFVRLLKDESSLVVDFSNLRHLKSVVRTVLSSKPGCLLSCDDKDHICSLLLRAFLNIVPSTSAPVQISDDFNIKILSVEGLPPNSSRILKGALVKIPDTEEKIFLPHLARGSPFKVCLFTSSLAGEADWPVESLETTTSDLAIASALKLLDDIVSRVVLDEVDFLFCQKVVHPRMKKRLQKAGIMILDRLGSEAAKCVQYISGGNSNTLITCDMSYGKISNISIEHIGKKSFLLLSSDDAPLFSIVLAHYNADASTELKIVCRQAIDSLLRILKSSRVCFGGGCSEIHTALLLSKKVRGDLDAIKSETGCTAGEVLESLSTFLKGITNACTAIYQGKVLDFATESTHGHLWKLHEGQFPTANDVCQCGSYEAESVDSLSWHFLLDIGHLYGGILQTDMSSELPTTKIPPTMIDQSLDVRSSFPKDVQPSGFVSNNPVPVYQLPISSSLNYIPVSHIPPKPLCNLTASKSSSQTHNLPVSYPATNKWETVCQLPTGASLSSYGCCVPGKSANISNQMFADINCSQESISSIGRDFSSTIRRSHTRSDITDSFVCLDELSCKLNCLSLAFETASLLLKTTVCVNNIPG